MQNVRTRRESGAAFKVGHLPLQLCQARGPGGKFPFQDDPIFVGHLNTHFMICCGGYKDYTCKARLNVATLRVSLSSACCCYCCCCCCCCQSAILYHCCNSASCNRAALTSTVSTTQRLCPLSPINPKPFKPSSLVGIDP